LCGIERFFAGCAMWLQRQEKLTGRISIQPLVIYY
jgi:hypothetical protein